MPNDLHPWRSDFSTVAPLPLRLARFSLRLCRAYPQAVQEYVTRFGCDRALSELLLPLCDRDKLNRCLQSHVDAAKEEEDEGLDGISYLDLDDDQELERAFILALKKEVEEKEKDKPKKKEREGEEEDYIARSVQRGSFDLQVFQYARKIPRRVRKRLARQDGRAPLNPALRKLGQGLTLTEVELQVLDYLDALQRSQPLCALLNCLPPAGAGETCSRLARLLAVDEAALSMALRPKALLRSLDLLSDTKLVGLESFLAPTQQLTDLLSDSLLVNVDHFQARLLEPAPAAAWSLSDFPHLAAVGAAVGTVLGQAAHHGEVGVNALIYGPPGSGKTELARALAAAQGLRAFQVHSADQDGQGLELEERLSAYLLAQRLLARQQRVCLIFDDVEEVSGEQTGWINRILEENAVPAIWITNSTAHLAPAFLRRFLLSVECRTPSRSVRRQMAERHLGTAGVSPALLDEVAADAALRPAYLGAARRLVGLRTDTSPEQTVREGVSAIRTLLHGAPAPWQRRMSMAFDVAFLNLGGDLSPSTIVRALEQHGRGSLCFFGPPGTGKTAFAEVLTEALDRELMVRQVSDLVSPYVGETEQNLARMFSEADPRHTVLLLDEVDSFLTDRRRAQHSWERTRVNELLQQMERYSGIFIAATNLMSGLDQAAMRRFDFKLHFRALNLAQRRTLFAREALGDEDAPLPPAVERQLATLEGLAPGDFATVCRQQALLGERLSPEQFLLRLAGECRFKQKEGTGLV